MPPFCVDGTSVASSPLGAPFSSVNSRPRSASLVPLVTLPPSLGMSGFMIATCCHSPMVMALPPLAAGFAAAAGAAVGLAAAAVVGAAGAAVGAAGAEAVVGLAAAAGAL